MKDIQKFEAQTSFLGRIFCRAYDSILATDKAVIVRRKGKTVFEIPYTRIFSFPNHSESFFSANIEIPKEKGGTHRFGWLRKDHALKIRDFLNSVLKVLINTKIETNAAAFDHLTLIHYPRDSWEKILINLGEKLRMFAPALGRPDLIDAKNRTDLERIYGFLPVDMKKLRTEHERLKLEERREFLDGIEKYPLTPEQRLAVIRSNDRNLVLAAAGTGKTSVIVSKVFDIIERGLCRPDEILVMAFNRAAAAEVRERFLNGARKRGLKLESEPDISTFHALGRKILAESGIRPTVSVLAEDQLRMNAWITKWVDSIIAEDVDNFLSLLRFIPEPFDPFECDGGPDFERSVRDNEFRTLKGERTRGYQELLIANFLLMHGVDYSYEKPYVTKRRIEPNLDYRPDFHITGTDIYIEHFGVDRQGNTRRDIDPVKYREDMQRKRDLHREQGTTLIETYHYEWKEETLLPNLRKKLESHGIRLHSMDENEVRKIIEKNREKISFWGEILRKALAAVRIENLDEEGIFKRFKDAGLEEPKLKTQMLTRLLKDYKDELSAAGSIDFDDMILKSSELVESGQFKPKWRYILVDEFQDISTSRKDLVTNLVKHGPSPSLTVVGDDWQAIYRFAGGKLEFTTRFQEFFGKCTSTFLRRTFRYHDNIASVSEKFVTENPHQIKKNVEAHVHAEKSQIFLHDHLGPDGRDDWTGKTLQIARQLRKTDKTGSIAVIARYNFLLNDIKMAAKNLENVDFWTFHKAKGLEADHVILVGLTQGKLGFPSENRDEAMVAALLPLADDYPHSEERRLMYVGMTRPRKQLHIIADPHAVSPFIAELLSAWYDVNIVSTYFEKTYHNLFKCPYCSDGYLKRFSGKYGDFYACSMGRGCPVGKARVCEKCGFPSVDAVTVSKCTNPVCGHSFPICERCGRPMRVRNGKFGQFLGCSGYGIRDDQCRNTRKL